MQIAYDLKKLEDALYDFYCVTGVTITFYDVDFKPIKQKATHSARYCNYVITSKHGRVACERSNAYLLRLCKEKQEPVRHVCGAGLVDITVPLLYAGNILGYLMLGQIRRRVDFSDLPDWPDLDRAELETRYGELPCHNEEEITAIMHIAVMLTKYILLENMIRPRANSAAEAVTAFVEAHLSEKLTARRIARHVHLSESGIYKAIHAGYGCTLGAYITARRVERSLPLLREGALSIEEIATTVGFSSAAYYSRCFKQEKGVSPLQYRRRTTE